jgi:hypothetical protein
MQLLEVIPEIAKRRLWNQLAMLIESMLQHVVRYIPLELSADIHDVDAKNYIDTLVTEKICG